MHSLSFRPVEAKSIGSYAPDRRAVARRGLISLLKLPRTTEHPNRFIAPVEYNRLAERTRWGRMVGQLSSCLLLQHRRISDRGGSWPRRIRLLLPPRVYREECTAFPVFPPLKSCAGLFGFISTAGYLLPSFFLSSSVSPGACTYAPRSGPVLSNRYRKKMTSLSSTWEQGGGDGKKYLLASLANSRLANPEFNRRHVFHCLAPAKQSIRSETLPIRPLFLFILRTRNPRSDKQR